MADNAKRSEALDTIRRNIAQHGLHVYVVQGPPLPRFAYTIGLRDSVGVELILPGAIFYIKDEVVKIINSIADRLRTQGCVRQGESFSVDSLGSFTLRNADLSWTSKLLLGALDYYGVAEIAALQVVPDKAHWTVDVPDMDRPWGGPSATAWRWLDEPWTYPVPEKSVAATNLAALRGERVTEAVRWEEDEWEISAGPAPDVPKDEMRVVPLGTLIAADTSLSRVVNLALEEGIWRDADSDWQPWVDSKSQTA